MYFNIVCGSTLPEQPGPEAGRSERHEVRCCSDTNLGSGWLKKSNCNVWGESKVRGACRRDRTHDQARTHCADAGARLYTKDELL